MTTEHIELMMIAYSHATAKIYALKVSKEQELLPKLAKNLSVATPAPIKMGKPSEDYPYAFSIYKWLDG